MKYRKLGNSGIDVSVIGHGTWQLGNDYFGDVDGKLAIDAIRASIDAGVEYGGYGGGLRPGRRFGETCGPGDQGPAGQGGAGHQAGHPAHRRAVCAQPEPPISCGRDWRHRSAGWKRITLTSITSIGRITTTVSTMRWSSWCASRRRARSARSASPTSKLRSSRRRSMLRMFQPCSLP